MHTESQWRYRAKRQGLRLVRYGQSLGYPSYGPYGLVERDTGRVVAVQLGPEEVERILFDGEPEAVLATAQLQASDGDDRYDAPPAGAVLDGAGRAD